MTRREWMLRNFGARPSTLPQAALSRRVQLLARALAAARKRCHDTEKWDAIWDAVGRVTRGRDRPDA